VDEALGGDEYIFDVPNFRNQPREFTLRRVFDMTERRFRVARHLIHSKPWDFFMLVEMGPDRLHHMFWQFVDPEHPRYVPGNEFESSFRDYYRALDNEVGQLLEALPDDVVVFVLSDHGGRPMHGGVQFNEWLAREGSLTFAEPWSKPTAITDAPIDWARTAAGGDGGYYGRLFPNVKGR